MSEENVQQIPAQPPTTVWDVAITLAANDHIAQAIAKYLEPAPRLDVRDLIPLIPVMMQLLQPRVDHVIPPPPPPFSEQPEHIAMRREDMEVGVAAWHAIAKVLTPEQIISLPPEVRRIVDLAMQQVRPTIT